MADETLEPKLFRKIQLKGGVEAADFETKQVFVDSKDGTRWEPPVTTRDAQTLTEGPVLPELKSLSTPTLASLLPP